MALHKPGVDQLYAIRSDGEAAFGSAAKTVCAWVKPISITASFDVIFGNIQSTEAGSCTLRFDPAAELDFIWATGPSTTATASLTHGHAAPYDWYWWFGGVDASGNYALGVIDQDGTVTEATGSSTAPNSGTPAQNCLLSNSAISSTAQFQAYIADFRFYNRLLSATERKIIAMSQGRDTIIDGLVSRLPMWDAGAGTDTTTVLPIDIADTSRSWTASGAGTVWEWVDGVVPLRRRT